jgi:hypothetical protein
VSDQFGISHSSVDRHWSSCLTQVRAAAAACDRDAAQVLDGGFLAQSMSRILSRLPSVADDLHTRWVEGDPSVRPADLLRAIRDQPHGILAVFKLAEAAARLSAPSASRAGP